MASNNATASFALFDCKGPIRCNSRPGYFSRSGGHLRFASCTRFSPNTRCPAAMTGSIASASKVLETAISVTPEGSRFASLQARTISARTCSSPLISISNKRTWKAFLDAVAGELRQRRAVVEVERPMLPAHGFGLENALQRLVGVHQRHAQSVGQVLLGEREGHRPVLDEARLLGAHEHLQ